MRILSRCFIIGLTLGVIFFVKSMRSVTPAARRGDSHRAHAYASRGLTCRTISIKLDGRQGVLHVVKIDPRRCAVKILRASDLGMEVATAETLAKKTGASAVINGGFFDQNNKPLGLVVIGHKVRNPMHPADWGVFLIRKGRPRIVHSRDFRHGRETYALQSGPRLVVHRRVTTLKPRRAFRSAVGVTDDGHVVLVATEDIALDLSDFAEVVARPESDRGVGCVDALNLDGGPSTQLYINSPPWKVNLPGGWGVPTAIGVFTRESANHD